MDIEYLIFLQNIRNKLPEFINDFMMMVSNAALFFQFLIPMFLYWCISKRKALFVSLGLGFSLVFNQLLKNIFCVYRPWVRDPRIQPYGNAIATATGYSFPSGHSQIAAATFGGVAYCYWREKTYAKFLIIIALLVGFSRNYLGCHTPQDVVAGLAVGGLFVAVMHYLLGWAWSKPGREKWLVIGGLAFTALMLVFIEFKSYPIKVIKGILLVDPEKMKIDCYTNAGILSGILIGYFLENKFVNLEIEVAWKRKTARFAAGSGLAAFIFIGMTALFSTLGVNPKIANFFSTFTVMFFAFFLGPLAIKFLDSLKQSRV